jgi:hypothetical protein
MTAPISPHREEGAMASVVELAGETQTIGGVQVAARAQTRHSRRAPGCGSAMSGQRGARAAGSGRRRAFAAAEVGEDGATPAVSQARI